MNVLKSKLNPALFPYVSKKNLVGYNLLDFVKNKTTNEVGIVIQTLEDGVRTEMFGYEPNSNIELAKIEDITSFDYGDWALRYLNEYLEYEPILEKLRSENDFKSVHQPRVKENRLCFYAIGVKGRCYNNLWTVYEVRYNFTRDCISYESVILSKPTYKKCLEYVNGR